jgi:NADPH-dependent curcumin reductase CurA
VADLGGWMKEGKLRPLETVVEGFEQLPSAINMLFDGANTGKLVVHVAD